jgi:2-oxoisovalerate dehydrogenase E1 component alpha subunit
VLFPGALNSEFTDKLDFIQPTHEDAIPTYRVMNQYGEILDKEIGVDTEDEEALQIYKNMVKRESSWTWPTETQLTAHSEHNGPPHV